MVNIRESINAIFFTPIPGLRDVPGISRITGSGTLRELQKRARHDLDNQRIQEEIKNIEIDYTIMQGADLCNQHDRDIQTSLFGKPVYDTQTHTYMHTTSNPDLQPVLDQFSELELLKRNIRESIRPQMEKQIEAILEDIKKSDNVVSKKLDKMIQELQRTRLLMLTERTHMLSKRQDAYRMAEAYLSTDRLRHNPAAPVAEAKAMDPLLARISDVQDLTHNLNHSKLSDEVIEENIKEQYEKLVELQVAGDQLKKKINDEIKGQKRSMRKRATVGALLLTTTGLVGFAGREMAAEYRRTRPYEEIVNSGFSPVPMVKDDHDQDIFKHRYHNPFGRPEMEISGHHIEQRDGDPTHGLAAARIFDLSARVASGEEDVNVDHGFSPMQSLANRSVSTPFLKQSYFVPGRNADVERMMTSTTQHHVISNSAVSNSSSNISTGDEASERDLFFRTTQPYFCACGNDGRESDIGRTQYSSAIMHLPRHSFQIGYASDYRPGNGRGSGIYTSPGNHPYPFMLGFVPEGVPDINQQTGEMTGSAAAEGGSSYATPSIAGNDFALIREYPQLTMDQYHYALAFAGNRNRLSRIAGSTRKDSDMAFYPDVGFGVPDPAMTELVALNMLYNRTQGIGVDDKPEIVYANLLKMGEARKEHEFALPADKAVYKVTFEIVVPDTSKTPSIKITTATGHQASIRLVPGQGVNRFTWYGDMGLTGAHYHITSDQDVRIGIAAHVNTQEAITAGITNREQLLSRETIEKRMDIAKLDALPLVPLITPALVDYKSLLQPSVNKAAASQGHGR